MPTVPTKAHRFFAPEMRHQGGQVFLTLGVFQGDFYTQPLRLAHHRLKARRSLGCGIMPLKADVGMRYHQRNAVFGAGAQALDQLGKHIGRFLARFPQQVHAGIGRVDGLIQHAFFLGDAAVARDIRLARPAGEKALEADLPQGTDLLLIRQGEG